MNAFDSTRTVEARGMAALLPFLEEHSDGRFVLTDKGRMARMLQEEVGDVLFNSRHNGRIYSVEIKIEARWTGNLFLETFSNRNLEDPQSHACRGSTVGWLFKTRADLLLYYFLDRDLLYVLDVFSLKRWAFRQGQLWDFEERPQAKYPQANDTWGRLVPVAVLQVNLEVPVRSYRLSDLGPCHGEAA